MDGPGTAALTSLLPLLVLAGALVVARRLVRRRSVLPGGSVRVTSRTGLSRGALVAVVEVDGRRLLVGATEHAVDLLSELEPAAAAAPIGADDRAADAGRPTLFPGAEEPRPHRPWSGLLDRARAMTVRTPIGSPSGVPPRV